jgi:hypothetical protein
MPSAANKMLQGKDEQEHKIIVHAQPSRVPSLSVCVREWYHGVMQSVVSFSFRCGSSSLTFSLRFDSVKDVQKHIKSATRKGVEERI